MALTLDQYVRYLDGRGVAWPEPPCPAPPPVKPFLPSLPDIRAITWSPYGALLCLTGGEFLYEHPQDVVMDLVLEKTIQEFKMWQSMSRKPGQPAESLRPTYLQVLNHQRTVSGRGERFPEVPVDKVWEALIKKLLQKNYSFDSSFYGSLNEFGGKVAYFFHASLQGVAGYPHAREALGAVAATGRVQTLVGNGQCFTLAQLRRCLCPAHSPAAADLPIDSSLSTLSYEVCARQPSEVLFRRALEKLAAARIRPQQVLHVGARVTLDVIPARRLGMRTALFAGDKGSVQATSKQLGQAASRSDALLTDLRQVADVIK